MNSEATTIHVSAPAKLNLGLRVEGRRADGYHLLESLFVPLDLADQLEVRIDALSDSPGQGSASISFALEWDSEMSPDPGVPRGEGNIAVEAARRFLDEAGIACSVSIRLRKSIPSGAGLGGGSSDAGAVLRALRDRFPSAHSPDALASLALELGADVPFFLDPRAACVMGIGEQIEPVSGWSGLGLLLANPGVSLATAEVFRIYDGLDSTLTPADPGSTMRALKNRETGSQTLDSSLESLSEVLDSGLLVNDLEAAACNLCPAVGQLRERIHGLGASWTGMSGSGATVYGIFEDLAAAKRALEKGAFEASIWARVALTV